MPGLNSFPEIEIKDVDGKTFVELFNINPKELQDKMDKSLYSRVDYSKMMDSAGRVSVDVISEAFTTFVNIYKNLSNQEILYMVVKFIEGYIFGEAMSQYQDPEADDAVRRAESRSKNLKKSIASKKKNATRR